MQVSALFAAAAPHRCAHGSTITARADCNGGSGSVGGGGGSVNGGGSGGGNSGGSGAGSDNRPPIPLQLWALCRVRHAHAGCATECDNSDDAVIAAKLDKSGSDGDSSGPPLFTFGGGDEENDGSGNAAGAPCHRMLRIAVGTAPEALRRVLSAPPVATASTTTSSAAAVTAYAPAIAAAGATVLFSSPRGDIVAWGAVTGCSRIVADATGAAVAGLVVTNVASAASVHGSCGLEEAGHLLLVVRTTGAVDVYDIPPAFLRL